MPSTPPKITCSPRGHTIVTERLMLRPATLEDVPALCGALDDEGKYWLGFSGHSPQSLETAVHLHTLELRGAHRFAVTLKSTGEVIGARILYPTHTVSWDLCSWLSPDHRGQGLGSENLRATLGFAHDHLGISVVRATSAPGNEAAHRQLRAAGMSLLKEQDTCHVGNNTPVRSPLFEHRRPGRSMCTAWL